MTYNVLMGTFKLQTAHKRTQTEPVA